MIINPANEIKNTKAEMKQFAQLLWITNHRIIYQDTNSICYVSTIKRLIRFPNGNCKIEPFGDL